MNMNRVGLDRSDAQGIMLERSFDPPLPRWCQRGGGTRFRQTQEEHNVSSDDFPRLQLV